MIGKLCLVSLSIICKYDIIEYLCVNMEQMAFKPTIIVLADSKM